MEVTYSLTLAHHFLACFFPRKTPELGGKRQLPLFPFNFKRNAGTMASNAVSAKSLQSLLILNEHCISDVPDEYKPFSKYVD
jgi:hypothetical protein